MWYIPEVAQCAEETILFKTNKQFRPLSTIYGIQQTLRNKVRLNLEQMCYIWSHLIETDFSSPCISFLRRGLDLSLYSINPTQAHPLFQGGLTSLVL